MNRKIGGPKEAAEMLAGLDKEGRERILSSISKKDPALAQLLRLNMVVFEDLKYLTVKMIQDLLRVVKADELGLALRIGSKELRDHFLQNVSSSMKRDIKEILNGPPKPVVKVQEAVDNIMTVVRDKIDKGELVINKNSDEEYV